MSRASLNAAFSRQSMRRRYEVWFVRLLLADGRGAWWFRYLVLNPGASGGGCPDNPLGQPAQVWATWFPRGGAPQSIICGYPQQQLALSDAGATPFRLEIGPNRIAEDHCAGLLERDGQRVAWDLRFTSSAGYTMIDLGWFGFSHTPHCNAQFSGGISFNGEEFRGETLGYGVQSHNCGFRHRNSWSWAHAVFPDAAGGASAFEALECEMPLGTLFRRAILWHGGRLTQFPKLKALGRMRDSLQWIFQCSGAADGTRLIADVDGRGISRHVLPYLRTNCRGSFEVANNSLSRAALYLTRPGQPPEQLRTAAGAVLEMVGA